MTIIMGAGGAVVMESDMESGALLSSNTDVCSFCEQKEKISKRLRDTVLTA